MPIYDLSYRRIAGVRHARGLRFLPIAAIGIRHYFKKRVNISTIGAGMIPFVVGAFILLLPFLFTDVETIAQLPPNVRRFLHVSPDAAYLAIAKYSYWFVLLVALGSGSGAIANDMTSNALEIYFSRPITRFDYVIGKLLSVATLCACVSLAPLLLLSLLDLSLSSEPGYVSAQIPVIARIVVASLIFILPIALLVLAFSSLVKSARNVAVCFAAMVIGLPIVGKMLRHLTKDVGWSLLDLQDCLARLAHEVLGVGVFGEQISKISSAILERGASTVTAMPLDRIPTSQVGLVVLAWVAFALFVLHRRVRGFEVVKG